MLYKLHESYLEIVKFLWLFEDVIIPQLSLFWLFWINSMALIDEDFWYMHITMVSLKNIGAYASNSKT